MERKLRSIVGSTWKRKADDCRNSMIQRKLWAPCQDHIWMSSSSSTATSTIVLVVALNSIMSSTGGLGLACPVCNCRDHFRDVAHLCHVLQGLVAKGGGMRCPLCAEEVTHGAGSLEEMLAHLRRHQQQQVESPDAASAIIKQEAAPVPAPAQESVEDIDQLLNDFSEYIREDLGNTTAQEQPAAAVHVHGPQQQQHQPPQISIMPQNLGLAQEQQQQQQQQQSPVFLPAKHEVGPTATTLQGTQPIIHQPQQQVYSIIKHIINII